MTQFWKFVSIIGAALSLTVAGTAQAIPNDVPIREQLNGYNSEGYGSNISQVNNVFQLRDVSPGDWVFDALRNLVENYNCIAGYPNGTFRGDRPLSRYEFAAGLNACLQQIERLIANGGAEVNPADLTRISTLTQQFQRELATLDERINNIEGRVAALEENQFSTTTKLRGEIVFALADSFGDTATSNSFRRNGTENDESETTLSNRVRLTLETSFTGRDTLITRLAAGNSINLAPASSGLFSNGTMPADGGSGVGTFIHNLDTGNDVNIDWLAYYFPVADKVNTYVAAFGGLHSDYISTTFGAKGLEDFTGGNGSLTYFAASSPIYLIGGGSGVGLNFPIGSLDISLGYLANEASNPNSKAGLFQNFGPDTKAGLFDGDYGALVQVAFNLGDRAEIGLTYVTALQTDSMFASGGDAPLVGSSGGSNNIIFLPVIGFVPPIIRSAGPDTFSNLTSAESNTFGLQGRFDITDNISLSLYGLYSDVVSVRGGNHGEIWSYAASIGFNDFGKEGNVLGLSVGVPPYVGGRDGGGNEVPLQIEGFYKYQLNDNISITPGVVWVDNVSEGFYEEDSAVLSTIRTTFTF